MPSCTRPPCFPARARDAPLRHARAGRALAAWVETVATCKRHRALVARFGARLRHALAHRALAAWEEYVALRARARALVERMAGGRRIAQLTAAWRSWTAFFA